MSASDHIKKLEDPANVAKLLVKPRDTIVEWGLDPDDEETARTFEKFIQKSSAGIEEAGTDLALNNAAWPKGIGMGCCNLA